MEVVGSACCSLDQGVVFIVAGTSDPAGKRVIAVCNVDGEEVIGRIGFAWREEVAFVQTMKERRFGEYGCGEFDA